MDSKRFQRANDMQSQKRKQQEKKQPDLNTAARPVQSNSYEQKTPPPLTIQNDRLISTQLNAKYSKSGQQESKTIKSQQPPNHTNYHDQEVSENSLAVEALTQFCQGQADDRQPPPDQPQVLTDDQQPDRKQISCNHQQKIDQLQKRIQELELCQEEFFQIKAQASKGSLQVNPNFRKEEKASNSVNTSQSQRTQYQKLKNSFVKANNCIFSWFSKFKVLEKNDRLTTWRKIMVEQQQLTNQGYADFLESAFLDLNEQLYEKEKSQLLELENSISQIQINSINNVQFQQLNAKLEQAYQKLKQYQHTIKKLEDQNKNNKNSFNQMKFKALELEKQEIITKQQYENKIQEIKKQVVNSFKTLNLLDQALEMKELSYNGLNELKKQECWPIYLKNLTTFITCHFESKVQQIERIKDQIKAQTQKQTQLTSKYQTVQAQLQQIKKANEALKNQISSMSQLTKTIQQQKEDSIQKQTEIQKQLASLRESKEYLSRTVGQLKNQINQAQNQHQTIILQNKEIIQQRDLLKKQFQDQKQSNSNLQKDIQLLQQSIQQLKQQQKILKSSKDQNYNMIQKLKVQKEELISQAQVLNGTITNLTDEIRNLTDENQQSKLVLNNMTQEKLRCQNLLRTDIVQQDIKIKQLQRQLQDQQKNNQSYLNQSVHQTSMLQQRNATILETEAQLNITKTQLADKIKDYKYLEEQIKERCNQMESEFKAQVSVLHQKMTELESDLRTKTAQLNASQQALKAIKMQVSNLKSSLQARQGQLQTTEEKLRLEVQNYNKSQSEWLKMVKDIQTNFDKQKSVLKLSLEKKIKQLEEDYTQKNQISTEAKEKQINLIREQSTKSQLQLKKTHNQHIQKLELNIKQLNSQIQSLRKKQLEHEEITGQNFIDLTNSIDRNRERSDKEAAEYEALYQTLFIEFQKAKTQNHLLFSQVELNKQEINTLEKYLQKQDSDLMQQHFKVFNLEAKLQQQSLTIQNLECKITEEIQKSQKIQNEIKSQFEEIRCKRELIYKQSCEAMVQTLQAQLKEQERRSFAQIDNLKTIINSLQQTNRLKQILGQTKHQLIQKTNAQNAQTQNRKQAVLQLKVTQMKQNLKGLQLQLYQSQQNHKQALEKLNITKKQLQIQTQKIEELNKKLESCLNLKPGDTIESKLSQLQDQIQEEQPLLSLFVANLRSNIQRILLSTSVLQREKMNLSSLLRDKDAQNTELLAEVKRLAFELEQEAETIRQILDRQENEKSANLQKSSSENDQLKAKNDYLEAQIKKYKRSVQNLQTELNKKDKLLESSQNANKQEKDSLQQRIRQLEEKSKIQSSTYLCEQTEKKQLEIQLNKLKEQKASLLQQVEKNKFSRREADKQNIQQEKIARYEGQKKKQEQSLTKQREKSQNLQKTVKQLNQRIKDLQSKLQKQGKINVSSNRLQSQSEQLIRQRDYLKDQLQFLKATNESLEYRVKSQQEQLQIEKAANERKTLKIRELEEVNRSAIKIGSSTIRALSPRNQFPPKQAELSKIRQTSPKRRQVVETSKIMENSKVLFSSQSLLDKREEQKQFLLASISKYFDKKCYDSTRIFAMDQNSKFRSFNLILSKPSLTQQSLLYLFRSKGSNNSENIFAFVSCRTKTTLPVGLLLSLTKKNAYPRKSNFDQRFDAARYEYSGELVIAGTFKLKPGEKKLECLTTKDKYFDVRKNSQIFDLQVGSVDLLEMQIHQIDLQ